MRAPESTGRRASERRPTATATSKETRTVVGLGVPVAASSLRLDDEETITYGHRYSQSPRLSTLLAECGRESIVEASDEQPTSESPTGTASEPVIELARSARDVLPRGSFHTVPAFPDDPDGRAPHADSNLHQFDNGEIKDSLRSSVDENEAAAVPLTTRHDPIADDPIADDPIADAPPARRVVLDLVSEPVDSIHPPERPPSRVRKVVAWFLFLSIASTVAVIAASAMSIATHRPWLDPRPHLSKGLHLAIEKLQALPKKLRR